MRTEGQEGEGVGESPEFRRSESELVALADAIRAAEELADEKIEKLKARKEKREQEIAAIRQRHSIAKSDASTLARELGRIARELERRFGDDQAGGGTQPPQG